MTRYTRKMAVLAKIETTSGTDSNPTGTANAMQFVNVSYAPIEGDEVSRDLMLPYLGNSGILLAGTYGKFEGEIEIAGAGTAGTAPAYGPLLRACGLAEVTTAGTSVVYSPVSAAFESISLYFNHDGVNHVLLNTRGNVVATFEPKKIPKFKFSFVGLLGTWTDAALPTVTLTGFKTPLLVSKTNTPTFTLHGNAAPGESLTLDLGQKVEPRFLIGSESIEISDRSASGTAVIEARPLATVNWFDRAKTRTRGTLQLIHGTTAGSIVQIDAPAVEIGKPTQGVSQGIITYSLPLILCPSAGNDELTITVK